MRFSCLVFLIAFSANMATACDWITGKFQGAWPDGREDTIQVFSVTAINRGQCQLSVRFTRGQKGDEGPTAYDFAVKTKGIRQTATINAGRGNLKLSMKGGALYAFHPRSGWKLTMLSAN